MRKSARLLVWVATKKGLWALESDAKRRTWSAREPALFGQHLFHAAPDPADPRVVVVAGKTGHLGPTVFRSADQGKTWKEASKPPAFPAGSGESVKHVFWMSRGHASRPGEWYAGTAPQALFRSADGGITWEGVPGFNEHPMRKRWLGEPENQPPDSPSTHSIRVDPRNADHLYVGCSPGGIFESLDGGKSWTYLNDGVENPYSTGTSETAFFHDPHCVQVHPANPDRLYMQNHFGIYRLDRPATTWTRIGRAMPKAVGDIGFPIVVHPRDPETAWVIPMDGTEVWPRTSVGGKPAVFVTRNGGRSWIRQAKGFPPRNAWWTVKRQCFAADGLKPLGLYFGTMSGQVWASRAEGARWEPIAEHLPAVQSVEVSCPA
jgi:photosystem II stability/assembly factor-like uncharacterized protein